MTNKLNVNNWPSELNIPKVTGTFFQFLSTRLTAQTRIDNSQTEIHQTTIDRVSFPIIKFWRNNFCRCSITNLLWRKNTKSNVLNFFIYLEFHFIEP